MKQFILFIFCALFFLISCSKNSKNQQTILSDTNCYPNDTRPSQAITYEEMAVMMEAFDNGAKKVLDAYTKEVTNGKDSISTVYNWYKLEDLKQYIAYIEKISKEKNIPVTGFRIYPSEYPKNASNQNVSGRQTLIFTPTTSVNGKDDVAFEPLYSENGKPVLISEFLEKARKHRLKNGNFLKSMDTTSIQSSSANRITPVPLY